MLKVGKFETPTQGFGCMGMTAFYGPPPPEDAMVDVMVKVFEAGCTHFDTAEAYRAAKPGGAEGEFLFNEELLGQFLKKVDRSKVTIATKMMPLRFWDAKCDPETLEKAVDASLARLGTDYID